MTRALAILLVCLAGVASACPDHASVPRSLGYLSPYQAGDPTKSRIDPVAQAEMQVALKPVDDSLRALARLADHLSDPAAQACLIRHLRHWADADGLRDLTSQQARLTIGARLAALAILVRRLRISGISESEMPEVLIWLKTLAKAQIEFWEHDAPARAKQGNLAAWAALAIWVIGEEIGNLPLKRKAVQMHASVLCSANPDGSLPIEMARGRFALHYQLHALAPLVTLQAYLNEVEAPRPCAETLKRVVDFALSDIKSGTHTRALTGYEQSYFTGVEVLQPHELAWLEAYLTLENAPDARSVAESLRPLYNSKLGGNQTKLWKH